MLLIKNADNELDVGKVLTVSFMGTFIGQGSEWHNLGTLMIKKDSSELHLQGGN